MPVLSLVLNPCLVTGCRRFAKPGTYLDLGRGPSTPQPNYLCEECEAACTPPYRKAIKPEPATLQTQTQLSLDLTKEIQNGT